MSATLKLCDASTVCRTCLKVLDKTGFTYLDDDSGYIKNVGNIREMLQFCIPELDLYVSSKPVICYQCLPILVQVYNFKIKCLNVENSIRGYITRNNLQEYNHVNLNCVIMDDLKIKSQKIQIENRIKHLMLQESGEHNPIGDNLKEIPETNEVVEDSNTESLDSINPMDLVETETNEPPTEQLETIERQMKIEIEEQDEANHDCDNMNQVAYPKETNENDNNRNNGNLENKETVQPLVQPKPKSIVAVRKDLFGNNVKNDAPPSFILNNGIIPQNGRIVIKIDKKRLQSLNVSSNELDSQTVPSVTPENAPVAEPVAVKPPPLTPIQTITVLNSSPEEPFVVQESAEPQPTYNCNKCSFLTQDVIKMYDHNRTYHSFDYTCQHCPFSTSKVELLGKHMTMVHPQNMVSQKAQNFKVSENYACTLCPFSVKNIDLLRSHHMSAHGNSQETDGKSSGPPIVLNSAFSEEIFRHEPKILKRLEYTCDVCPYSTRDKSNLRKHLFTHGTKPLKCDHCSYKCVSPYQLRRHQKQKHAKHCDLRARSQPYKLPDLQQQQQQREDMDEFKITLDTIKRELEKEVTT